MRCLIDFHHTDLFRSFQFLFEKRLGWEVFRPGGHDWFPQYYWHPIEAEALGNLTPHNEFIPEKHGNVLSAPQDGVLFRNFGQDGTLFRWLPLSEAKTLDLIVCTTDRNEQRFFNLRKNLGLKCPIWRYTGNSQEPVNLDLFDVFIPAVQSDFDNYVATGKKPGILFHPEIDLSLYSYEPPPQWGQPILRNFLNFTYSHREQGSPWETWIRFARYVTDIGGLALLHGLGTPPEGIEIELDVVIDTAMDRMGISHMKDRSKWPDLRFNRGEPGNHQTISDLMKFSNLVCHIKRSPPEGFGFIAHCLAATGRPFITEQDAYRHLSAYKFMQHRETCLFVSGHDPTDKENLRWALEPENNLRMAQTLHRRFSENVSFDGEARAIAKLL